MTARRRAAGALFALLSFDVLVLVVTGGGSPLQPGGVATPAGLGLRLLLLGAFGFLRLHAWAEPALRVSRERLLLLGLLLPTLFQFHFAGGRINGDGVMYYVYVHSLVKDADLDFTNEYTHYELIDRGDIAVKTKTGLRRSIFSVGPGVMSIPAFLAGEAVARAQAALGLDADLSGYGPTHRNAVALSGLLYGFAAILLVHGLLRRHFGEATALGACLLLWGTSFLHWYMVQQPTMSHAPSAFVAALGIWLWDRWRAAVTPGRALLLGLLLGFAMCVRWQNGLLLLLPGFDLLLQARRGLRSIAPRAALLGLGALVGAFPQMAAWKVLYGSWLLRDPPHGADFLRLDHPFLLETFFSSRHGLLSWTPALWAGYLGFLPLLRERRALALPLLPLLLAMSYVNACSGDWWAGGSFSNRRFDCVLPLLAVGFAGAIDAARRAIAARPTAAAFVAVAPFVVWNLGLAWQVQRGMVPRDDTVAFSSLAGNAARVVSDAVGFPTTWPASLVFAWREGLSPGRYDLTSGRYLFYRQNNMGGVIDLADPRHAPLLVEGFSRVKDVAGLRGRSLLGRARILAPLDVPEPLELRVLAVALERPAQATLTVNGREAGRLEALPDVVSEQRVAVPADFWRRELNDVVLEAEGGELLVSTLRFVRMPR